LISECQYPSQVQWTASRSERQCSNFLREKNKVSFKTRLKSSVIQPKRIMNPTTILLHIKEIFTAVLNHHLSTKTSLLRSTPPFRLFQLKRTNSVTLPVSLPEKLHLQVIKLKKSLNHRENLYFKWSHRSKTSIELQTEMHSLFLSTIKKRKDKNNSPIQEKAY
jgi:hypothetical protein